MIVVAKIGTASVTTARGEIDRDAVERLCHDVGELRDEGHDVVVVTSGAITAGLATLDPGSGRPTDPITLQALSAIGQHRLMRHYDDALRGVGLLAGQVLLAPHDFGERRQYLHARQTLERLLALGVVPVVNENDAVADDEIRFGDNDRIAALVANLVGAAVMVLLTDIDGVYDQDPSAGGATLLEEVREIDAAMLAAAGGPGSTGASGGMAAKLAAARIAAWSGVRVVIAKADRPGVVVDAVHGATGVGTVIQAQPRRLGARKLWIAFAVPAVAAVEVDAGAVRALVERDASLLPAGVTVARGEWSAGDAIDVCDEGAVIAKGIAQCSSDDLAAWRAERGERRTGRALVHRDDLVVLVGAVT